MPRLFWGNVKQALRNPLIALVLVLVGCAKTSTTEPPPPIAGLWHPVAVRPGQEILLDASTTAIAKAPESDPGLAGTRIMGFRFEIATYPAVNRQLPTLPWTFTQPGHYAVRLVVTDDLGRQSSVESAIDVVADLAESCTGTAGDACYSGVCAASQCATFACAGDPACPAVGGHALWCDRGVCGLSPAPSATDDAYGGDDVSTIGAADAGSP